MMSGWNTGWKIDRAFFVAAVVVLGGFLALTSDVSAQRRRGGDKRDQKTEKTHDLRTIAKLGKGVRGNDGFFDVTYSYRDKKGKKKSQKAYLQIDKMVDVYLDRQVRLQDLEAGKKIFILGRAIEREVQERGGGAGGVGGARGGQRGGKDRQIQNARVILTGDQVEVNRSYLDPKDKAIKWIEAIVSSSNAGLWVKYEGNEFRVTLGRKAPILVRVKLTEKERKILKKAKYIHLVADESKVRPETKRRVDLEKPSFEMKRLIVLDPRLLTTVYPLLFPR